MIITKKIIIKNNTSLKSYYEKLGYDMSKELVEICVEDLPKASHQKIMVSCDCCGKEREMDYKGYNIRFDNSGFYACNSCKFEKTKITNNKLYGVDNCFQNEDMKNKGRNKCVKKYGVEWYTKTDEYKERYKYTWLENYGVENIFQNEDIKKDIKQKSRKTKIERGLINNDGNFDDFWLYKKTIMNNLGKLRKKL